MQREYPPPFSPTSSTDYNTNKSSSWRLFFLSKATNPATFVVFGDSKARITLQLGLLCSTSSGCCHEPLSRPKALTGGQSLSSLAQQSEQRGDTHPSASRLQMNRACAWPPPFPPWLTERGVNVNVNVHSLKNKSLHLN